MRENQDGEWAQKRQWACRSELLVERMIPWGDASQEGCSGEESGPALMAGR